jgi:UDP-N-acetylmuramoyl-L-alanyl-D-glutamate--2,6-diaminopimelate ligase
MVETGNQAAVVETTSHGLALDRVAEVAYDAAILTNLTHEHLELHKTFEAYLAAKRSLFERLAVTAANPIKTEPAWPKTAIINLDDPSAPRFMEAAAGAGARLLTYGADRAADVRATAIEEDAHRLRVRFDAPGGAGILDLRLAGRFNAHNALAVVALGEALALDPAAVREGLESVATVPGRMERIDAGQPFQVVVDIASTETALTNVLAALRPATAGRLWVVFGAAGGRDPARRDGLGRAASRLADRAVITNEDPRQEDPDAIIATIAEAMTANGRREGQDFVRIPDRRSAIRHAFENAGPGDTVLLAGKATETTMVFADGDRPWDERAVARELLGS